MVDVVVVELVVVEVVEIASLVPAVVVVDACKVVVDVPGNVDEFALVVAVEGIVVAEKVLGFDFLFDGRVKSNSFCIFTIIQ